MTTARLLRLVLFGLALQATGCEPTVPRDALGELQFEVPKVAGAEQPYRVPEAAGPVPPEPSLRDPPL